MLSKLLPWDFVSKYPKTIDQKKMGIYAYLIDDPYLERLLLDRLPRKEVSFSVYTGADFTRDFIEEHFINLSFFSQSDHLLIMNAENIAPSSWEFFVEAGGDLSDRFLLLFFTKSSKLFTELVKNKKITVQGVELEAPRFWEGPRLWQFAQGMKNVRLDGVVSRFALENLEHNLESFVWFIDTVQMHFDNSPVDISKLSELVKKERWDFFELIEIFNKSPKSFFAELLKKEMDYEWFRALSAFMQSHLIKALFPEDIAAKAKLSKYDQSVLQLSEKEGRDVLKYYLSLFSELEILSKSSDVFLLDRLRLESLK